MFLVLLLVCFLCCFTRAFRFVSCFDSRVFLVLFLVCFLFYFLCASCVVSRVLLVLFFILILVCFLACFSCVSCFVSRVFLVLSLVCFLFYFSRTFCFINPASASLFALVSSVSVDSVFYIHRYVVFFWGGGAYVLCLFPCHVSCCGCCLLVGSQVLNLTSSDIGSTGAAPSAATPASIAIFRTPWRFGAYLRSWSFSAIMNKPEQRAREIIKKRCFNELNV